MLLFLDLLSSSAFFNTYFCMHCPTHIRASAKYCLWETLVKNGNTEKYNQKQGKFLELHL